MSQEFPPASIGDLLPHVILPNAKLEGVNLGHQARAGRWIVLAFVDPSDVPSRLDALAAARERMNKFGGYCYIVALGESDPELFGADMFDESGKAVMFLTSAPTAGIAVITPDGRLGANFGDMELDKAVMHCESRASGATTGLINGFAPVLMLKDLLPREMCNRVIKFWESNPKLAGGVASSAHGNDQEIAAIKRRQDVVLPDNALFEEIKQVMSRRVLPQIGRAFQMQVASMEALRIGRYSSEDAGAFGRHRDNSTPYTAHRRFALTINLNTGDYEGGELAFPEFGPGLYQPPRGGGIVFSATLLHEAMPVTRGQRFGMFTFFTDAAGLEQEKEMQTRMAEARQKEAPLQN